MITPAAAPAPVPAPPADDAHRGFLATRTFGALDGLRAISILAVVWHHTHEPIAGWAISGRGFLGVDLFFVISGFLIVTLLLRERRRTGTTSLKKFYVRRFLRIFPPYYLTLALVAAVAYLKPGNTSALLRHELPFAVFYVANMVPMTSLLAITWSLSVEEQFYLVVPALEKLAGRVAPWLLAGAWVLVSLPPFGLFAGLPLSAFFRQTTFGPILLGVLLAHTLDDPRGFRWVHRVLGSAAAPVVALVVTLAACSIPADDISGGLRILIHFGMTALLASCVVRERHALTPALRWWWMRRIGAVSYGIYLYHLLVRHAVDKALMRAHIDSQGLLFAGTALGTWAAAELSYWAFESRFLALKERWA
jgi:peptidoglycan/LPS O-acetylase OafA/YrhL